VVGIDGQRFLAPLHPALEARRIASESGEEIGAHHIVETLRSRGLGSRGSGEDRRGRHEKQGRDGPDDEGDGAAL
jgi:hypothetical protein